MNMYTVFLQILPLLLGAAISPVATTGMITVLATSTTKTRTRGFIYLIGTTIPLLVLGIPGIFLFSKIDIMPKNNTITSWIDLLAGIILLGLAVHALLRPKQKSAKSAKSDVKHAQSFGKIVALGTALMITNFSTLVLFVPAVKDVADSRLDSVEKLVLLFVSILVTILMIAIPLVIYILLPKKSEAILSSLKNFIDRHMREITLSLLIVFGVYLLIRGFGVFGIKA